MSVVDFINYDKYCIVVNVKTVAVQQIINILLVDSLASDRVSTMFTNQ